MTYHFFGIKLKPIYWTLKCKKLFLKIPIRSRGVEFYVSLTHLLKTVKIGEKYFGIFLFFLALFSLLKILIEFT